MRIETAELIEILKPFRNGCAYRIDFSKKGIVLVDGCYNLTGLATGAAKYLNELCYPTADSYKLSHKNLVEHPISVKTKIKKSYEICAVCDEQRELNKKGSE